MRRKAGIYIAGSKVTAVVTMYKAMGRGVKTSKKNKTRWEPIFKLDHSDPHVDAIMSDLRKDGLIDHLAIGYSDNVVREIIFRSYIKGIVLGFTASRDAARDQQGGDTTQEAPSSKPERMLRAAAGGI